MTKGRTELPSLKQLLLFLAFPFVVGVLLTLVDGADNWLAGFAAYAALLTVGYGLLHLVVGRLRLPGYMQRIVFIVFWSRLGIAVLLMILLPVLGYQDNPASKAGYLFQDAFLRDRETWKLAESDRPILEAFSANFQGDQYGGMLALGAYTYRILSPDVHRPTLVLIWIAFAGALSTAVFWKSVDVWSWKHNGEVDARVARKIATLSALVFGFYPEIVFLGSSHMRESLVLLGMVLMWWGFVKLSNNQPTWLVSFGLGVLVLLLFHPPMSVVCLLVIFGLFLLEPGIGPKWKYILWFAGFALVGITFMVTVWNRLPALSSMNPLDTILQWLRMNFNFQSHISERSSGMMQKLLGSLGEQWTLPVVLGYGALQPVLPAVLVDPGAWIWRIINTLRALGWYMLAPVVLFSGISVIRTRIERSRWRLLWLSLVCLIWLGVAAGVAGGDQWDNPRYRSLFIPWMAFLAAWGWQNRNIWLSRLWIAVGLFVLVFLEWYISRYYPALPHFDVRFTIVFAGISAIGFLIGSLVWDILRRKR